MKRTLVIILILCGLLFSGCGDKPECDSKEVRATLVKIIEENLEKLLGEKHSVKVEMIRTLKSEQNVCECSALVKFELGELGDMTEQVKYTVEFPDKRDGTFYVVIQDE